jgi:hypothetical protein
MATQAATVKPSSAPVIAPASTPEAAESTPASTPAPAAPQPKFRPPTSRPCGIPFSKDASTVLPGHTKEYQEAMMRDVNCYVAEDFTGTVQVASGVAAHRFSFKKRDMVTFPMWFALSHPKYLVIKE